MSPPSSEGRYSVHSEPSTTSSRTLHSRGSGAHVDNGEGSSQRASSAGTGDASRPSQEIQNPVVADLIGEEDFARRRQRVRRSGGFLLDSNLASTPRPKHAGHQSSVGDAKGKRSPRVREGHHVESKPSTSTPPSNEAQRQTIDPNQLVHMALNLSESRRRNISGGPLLAPQARATSGTQRDGSSLANSGVGGSLRQYLNEQRRASRNMSPLGNRSSPSRHMSNSMQRSSAGFNPSPQTLARRDKARDYIELRLEYLRLLDFLPPLKLDASAPGNFVISSSNVPGSPQAELSRMPSYAGKQHTLGRAYNPLQYIRNRRSRARERRTLDHASEEFTDVEQVREWVDRVEQHSQQPNFRQDDRVSLPKYHDDHPVEDGPSKPPRPHKGWIFTPEELLADAYWVEQGDNKKIIENRFGRILFPPKEAQKPTLLLPRASNDYPNEKRRASWVEDAAGIAVDPATGDESEKGSDRGRKRRLLTGLRADSPRHGKHSRRGSRLRATLDSDTSDSDTGSRKRKPRIIVDDETNTGPLALQLETLLKKQSTESQGKSPSIISPDTPDKWGRHQVDGPETKTSRDSLEVPPFSNGFHSISRHGSLKKLPRVRNHVTSPTDDIEPRSSYEDTDNTPITPHTSTRLPHFGFDMSPPISRGNSPIRKSRRSKLNPFHSHESSEDHKHNHFDVEIAPTDKKRGSRQPSEDTTDGVNVGHAIMAAPNAVKSFLGHRKNESTASLPSPDKMRRRDTQEPPSAVTRFFKGVKHEGSKVGGFVFRRDKPDDEDADNVSEYETDASAKGIKGKRPTISRNVTATTTGSFTTKEDGRYHLDLPTFKSTNETQADDESTPDHITRQNRERKSNRSPRFDRLAPPKMDLERISSVASTASFNKSRSQSPDRIHAVLAHPGRLDPYYTPPTGLRPTLKSDERQRSSSQPTRNGKRHWSIATDGEQSLDRRISDNQVTQADIVRVRALFLCSGIKAKEIVHRANAPRNPPPSFLIRAARIANRKLVPIPRKEEHVLAARLLTRQLESSTSSLTASTQHFRSQTIKEISDLISGLRSRLDDELMPRILDAGDKAVRITSEVSGEGPLQVKQITDDIEHMLRARRRGMKWLRGVGWMMVEWALVAVMWWVWLVVVLVGSVKKVCGFGIGVVRWLLWI